MYDMQKMINTIDEGIKRGKRNARLNSELNDLLYCVPVDWIKVDLSKPKEQLPPPLNCQSGGRFWVVCDGGIHGKNVGPSWWTGTKFLDWNNERITHFAKMKTPDLPEAI